MRQRHKKNLKVAPIGPFPRSVSTRSADLWLFESAINRSLIDVEACIFLAWIFEKKIQAIERKIQVVKRYNRLKGGHRKNAWRMWGNAKRKRNGIIYLTRNNDGLSRWRDKSAQILFYLLSHSVRQMDRKYKKITLHYLHYCTLEGESAESAESARQKKWQCKSLYKRLKWKRIFFCPKLPKMIQKFWYLSQKTQRQ